ncbi:MAG: helix-turn-helix domain-containing protein [Micavibrio sp.]|nr:helix-turn-helix domain-containing protein [Micavibrio sp.]
MEGLLYALSDPVRVEIFAEIAGADCPKTCSTFRIIADRKLPKSTLSMHFKILREAGLIRSVRKGIEMHSTTRCAELQEPFGELIGAITGAFARQQSKTRPRKKAATK